MKYFFAQLVLVIILTSVVWSGLYRFLSLRIYPYDYPMWKYKFEILNSPNINPKVIVLGDSLPTASIAPLIISKDMINLGLSGGTPVEAFLFLTQYLKIHKNPKLVIISFNPDSFHFQETFYHHAMMFNLFGFNELLSLSPNLTEENTLYSQGMDLPDMLRINMIKKNFFKLLYWADLIISKLSLSKYQLAFIPNLFNFEIKKTNEKILQEISESFGQHLFFADGKPEIPSESIKKIFAPDSIHILYMEKLLTLIDQKQLKVVIVTPPLNSIYQNNLEPQYFKKYIDFVTGFKARHTGLKFSDKIIFLPPEYFNDPEHVNEKGMKVFSEYLRDDLLRDELL